MPVPNTWKEALQGALTQYPDLSEEEQKQLGEKWIAARFAAAGGRDPKQLEMFKQEVFGAPPPDPNAFFPSTSEYPRRMLDMLERVGKVFATPQQFLSEAANANPELPWYKRVGETFSKTGKNLLKDVTGEKRELEHPYHWYTDPLVLTDAPNIVRGTAGYLLKKSPTLRKGAQAVVSKFAKKPEPPQMMVEGAGETVPVLEKSLKGDRIVPPEVSGLTREPPKVSTSTHIGPEETLAREAASAVAPRIIERMQKNGYTPEQAQLIQEWALQNPSATASKYITGGIGTLPENVKAFIEQGILNRTARSTVPPVRPRPKVKVEKAPPLSPNETLSAPEAANQPITPGTQMDWMSKLLKTPQP